jgi:asparagine synthase (glutamine-hydrolysing)
MTNRLVHRGPDDCGIWCDPNVPVGLGHRRLSIIDLSAEGHQPMLSASGRYVLVFNGEIYNYRDIRQELEGVNSFRGNSDTEVMLAAFERFGVRGALERFNGMFAFALWDRQERALHLSCDRFGEKPLYYGQIGNRLVFGSELTALRAHGGLPATIDRESLAHYLNCGYVPAPHSIFVGVRKLEPGTWITVPVAQVTSLPAPQSYWSALKTADRVAKKRLDMNADEAANRLEALLEDSIRLRMIADVPLGAFLSGGVDSSTVVALMQKISPHRVRTFTIGFGENGFDEAVHARAIARYLGTEHNEMYVSSADALAVIPRLPEIYDEPFADSSQIPTFLVSRFARTQVTVALSGDGADELFGGYERYVWAEAIWRHIRYLPMRCRTIAATAVTSLLPTHWDSMMRMAGPMLPSRLRQKHFGDKIHKLAALISARDRDELYLSLLSHWPTGGIPARGSGGFETRAEGASASPHDRYMDRMMLCDTLMYLPGDILCKVDRAAMAVSLESRVPFLDQRLFEFAWRLPARFKLRGGTGKWLLRQVLYRHVPRVLVDRPKSGFAIPLNAWLRGPLRDWAEALLNRDLLTADGLIDPEPVLRRWNEHLTGSRNWAGALWDVLMFQAWLHHQRSAAPVSATSAPRLHVVAPD